MIKKPFASMILSLNVGFEMKRNDFLLSKNVQKKILAQLPPDSGVQGHQKCLTEKVLPRDSCSILHDVKIN